MDSNEAVLSQYRLMILFSLIDSTICTVKNWYVIVCEVFAIRNKAATMDDVANDKSSAGIDENGGGTFKIICFYFSE